MSRIIRHSTRSDTIFIGEKHHDIVAEQRAEVRLGELFPLVETVTNPDGSKLIPVTEMVKLEAKLTTECEAARKRGYDDGHKAGLDKGLDEARRILKQFEKAIQDAVNQRAILLEEAKQKILELTLQISKKVTFDALDIDREATIGLIEGVIAQLVDRSRLKIKVHPDFLPILEQNMNRFLAGSTAIKELTFEADPRVREGGCFIETPSGDVDARLGSQFEVIAETLMEEKV